MEAKKSTREEKFLPGGIPRWLRIYDNGGRSLDHYTAVFTGRYRHQKTGGEFWNVTFNGNPNHPQHGIYTHSSSQQQIDFPTYGHLGKKIRFQDLPEDCQRALLEDYCYLHDLHVPGARRPAGAL